MDALTLARAQFAFTISFHIIFPVFSIGLASYLAVLNEVCRWPRGVQFSLKSSIIGKTYSPSPSAWASFPALS
jgi:cytochrome bd-type quinol oxidase subunit 1